MQQRGSPLVRLRRVMIPLAILQVLLGILNLLLGQVIGWLTIAAAVITAATWVWLPRLLASDRKRIQRSLDSSPQSPSGTA